MSKKFVKLVSYHNEDIWVDLGRVGVIKQNKESKLIYIEGSGIMVNILNCNQNVSKILTVLGIPLDCVEDEK